jgi:chaperone LolA
MAKKLTLLLALLTAGGSTIFGQPLPDAEVKQLLSQIREKRAAAPQVQADFREEKTMQLMKQPVVSSGHVWFQAPDKFRREVKGNSPSVTVSDGKVLWIFYPKFQSAERYDLGKRTPLDAAISALTAGLNLENVEATYNIGAKKIDNLYELQLTPRSGALKKFLQQFVLRLNEELQVTRTEMTQPNGDRVVTVYTNESRGAIPPATFEFAPPAGTNVTTPLGR